MPIELDANDLKNAQITLKVPRKGCACGGGCYQEIEIPLITLETLLMDRIAARLAARQLAENTRPANL